MNREIKNCLRDPLFRRVLFICCVISLAAIAFHFSLYASSVSENDQLRRQLDDVKAQYSYQQRLSGQLARLENVQVRLEALSAMLGRRFSSVAFSADMERFVSESGVEIVAQSYSPARVHGQFEVVEINIRVASDYKGMRRFISLIKESQFFVVIDRAKLESRGSRILGDLDLQVRYLGGNNG